jgi:hypothetical protein
MDRQVDNILSAASMCGSTIKSYYSIVC